MGLALYLCVMLHLSAMDPMKLVIKTCPYCGVQFTVYRTRQRISCSSPECAHKARSEAASRTQLRAYANGRRKSSLDPAVRAKIAEGMRRAHAEGRATVPSKRPEVAAKIAEAKRRDNPMKRPEIRSKVSLTMRMLYRSGLLKREVTPELRKKLSIAFQGRRIPNETRNKIAATLRQAYREGRIKPFKQYTPLTETTRSRIGQAVQRAWQQGRFGTRRQFRGEPTAAEMRLRQTLEPLGFIYQFMVLVPKAQGGKGYYRPDFVHPEFKLCIEVDGPNHRKTVRVRAHDAGRDQVLQGLGFRIVRITNADVMDRLDSVLQRIVSTIEPPQM